MKLPAFAKKLAWLPLLALTNAVGLLLVSLSYVASRNQVSWFEMVYWVGMLVIFVPTVARLLSNAPSRLERIGLISLLGLTLYLVKVFHSPIHLTFYDELLHWRTLYDITDTQHLFAHNALLVVSPLYPGLEITTNAVMNLTGLDMFTAGLLVVAVARLVIVLMVYFLYEAISESAYIASMGAVFYITNSFFLLFDAQFAYESVALPFAIATLFTIAQRVNPNTKRQIGWSTATILCMAVVVTSHHVTSYFLLACLAGWTAVTVLRNLILRKLAPMPSMHWSLLLAMVAVTIWLLYIASVTVSYLGPSLFSSVSDIVKLILGESQARQLFGGGGVRQTAPIWERLMAFAAAGLIMLGLFWGLYQVFRKHRTNAIYLTLSLGGLAYPASQILRFTQRGAEISSRIAPYLFVPLGFVLALSVANLVTWIPSRLRIGLLIAIVIIFMGGIVVSYPQWGRYPGPYLAAADTRSVEPQGISAAVRIREILGAHNRFAGDRINGLLMISFGNQEQVAGYTDNVNAPGLFLSPMLDASEIEVLCKGRIEYVVVDYRLNRQLPMIGYYYEDKENREIPYTTPLDPQVFRKFERAPFADRIFDSGDIVVYDVRRLNCLNKK